MSVQTQIDRISGAVQSALAALSEKGVEVPAGTKVDGLAALIAAIEGGGGSGGGGSDLIHAKEITYTPVEDEPINDEPIVVPHGLGVVPRVVIMTLPTAKALVHQYMIAVRSVVDNESVYSFLTARPQSTTSRYYATMAVNKNVSDSFRGWDESNLTFVNVVAGTKLMLGGGKTYTFHVYV